MENSVIEGMWHLIKWEVTIIKRMQYQPAKNSTNTWQLKMERIQHSSENIRKVICLTECFNLKISYLWKSNLGKIVAERIQHSPETSGECKGQQNEDILLSYQCFILDLQTSLKQIENRAAKTLWAKQQRWEYLFFCAIITYKR